MRFFSFQKKNFFEFIKNELMGWELEEWNPKDKKIGIWNFREFPYNLIKSNNIQTRGDQFEILLLAHYDTVGTLLGMQLINKGLKYFGLNFKIYITIIHTIFLMLVIAIFAYLFNIMNYIEWLYACFFIVFFGCLFLKPNLNNMNDNSSGVITVLAIARFLLINNSEMISRIKIVFTDKEETGLWGSGLLRKELIKSCKIKNHLIINFDAIGIDGDLYVQPFDWMDKYPQLEEKLKKYEIIKQNIKAQSDYDVFKNDKSIGFVFLKKSAWSDGYYIPNMHTAADVNINEVHIAHFVRNISQFLIAYANSQNKAE